jgi:hypothetical protein
MKHKFIRLFQRVAIKTIRLMNPDISNGANKDYDVESFAICKRLISKDETTLLISPLSGKRYIKSDDKSIVYNYYKSSNDNCKPPNTAIILMLLVSHMRRFLKYLMLK